MGSGGCFWLEQDAPAEQNQNTAKLRIKFEKGAEGVQEQVHGLSAGAI